MDYKTVYEQDNLSSEQISLIKDLLCTIKSEKHFSDIRKITKKICGENFLPRFNSVSQRVNIALTKDRVDFVIIMVK